MLGGIIQSDVTHVPPLEKDTLNCAWPSWGRSRSFSIWRGQRNGWTGKEKTESILLGSHGMYPVHSEPTWVIRGSVSSVLEEAEEPARFNYLPCFFGL